MKGLYPIIIYIILFAIGISIFVIIYNFTGNFAATTSLDIEKIQSEKICYFIKNLENREGEFELSIRDYRIETNPLRIIDSSIYACEVKIPSSGSCSNVCNLKVSDNSIVFS